MNLKKLVLLMIVLGISNINFGSESESNITKNLSLYMCGGSGNINPNTQKILNSWAEMGIKYSQNFDKVPWLSVKTTIAICGGSKGIHKNEKFIGTINTRVIMGYGKAGLQFSKYGDIELVSDGRIDMGVYYKIKLADGHALKLKSTVELYPFGNSFYIISHKINNILHNYDMRLEYGTKIATEWEFATELRLKFNGKTSSTSVKADSAQAFAESFHIRWNNTIAYQNPHNFGGWVQIRYQPKNLANPKP
ncbi:MAG: hypothetical protein ACRCV0_02525, partial [Brevinema sp.]